MPRFKSVTKLETLSLNQFCKICAITCTSLEEKADDSQQPSTLDAEGKFKSFLILLPRQILEQVITKTLTIITSEVRKKRSHKGLIKAIECLPQKSVQKLDLASLYSEVRLYGHVNSRCVFNYFLTELSIYCVFLIFLLIIKYVGNLITYLTYYM